MGTQRSRSHTWTKVAATRRAHTVVDNWVLVEKGKSRPSGHASAGLSVGGKEGERPGVFTGRGVGNKNRERRGLLPLLTRAGNLPV